MLSSNAERYRKRQTSTHEFVLTNLIQCTVCGSPYTGTSSHGGSKTRRKYPKYRHIKSPCTPMDTTQPVPRYFDADELEAAHREQKRRLSGLEGEKTNFLKLLAKHADEPEFHSEFKTQVERVKREMVETENQIFLIEGRIRNLEKRLYDAEMVQKNLECFDQSFDGLSLSRKQELLRGAIRQVKVYPSEIKMALYADVPTGPVLLTSPLVLCEDFKMAQEEGFEPPTSRLTAGCSTTELLLN